ncbi:MAG: YhcH/YjgK/YiaL family protein [Lentisphaerota bacterium]
MIHGKLTDEMPLALFPNSKTWEMAINWLKHNQTNTVEDIYPLGEDGFYARIMSYPLITREEARFEAHRHTIDLQYTVLGEEMIEIHPTEALSSRGDYSTDKDTEHFETPPIPHASVTNAAGFFSILFPVDAHMPKLLTPKARSVTKIVIKIPCNRSYGPLPT